MADETLSLVAEAVDDFSGTLERLDSQLRDVGTTAESVFPIDVEVRGTSTALAELEAVEQAADAVDDNLHVSSGAVDASTGVGLGGGGGGPSVVDTMNVLANDVRVLGRGGIGGGVGGVGIPGMGVPTPDSTGGGGGGGGGEAMTSGGRSPLWRHLRNLDLHMTDFYDIIATLLPALLTFVGALPAAITGVLTLAGAALAAAGALAAIGGLALLGTGMGPGGFEMERVTEQLGQVRQDFMDAFAPLAERLAPLFDEALAGLERFFDALASYGGVLLSLRDEARAFGGWLIEFVPEFIATLGRLAEAASPVFNALGDFLENTDIVASLAQETGQMLPTLARLGGIIVDLLPKILNLSQGFLDASTATLIMISFLGDIIGTIVSLNGLLPVSTELLGALLGLFLVGITILAAYVKIQALLHSEWLLGSASVIPSYISSMYAYIGAMELGTLATWGLYAALTAVLSIITFGLVGIVGSLVSQWSSLGGKIGDATDQLRNFESVRESMGTGISGSGTAIGPGAYVNYTDNSTTVVQGKDAESAAQTMSYREGTKMDSLFSNS